MKLWLALLTGGVTADRNSTIRGTGFSKPLEKLAARTVYTADWAGAVVGPPEDQTTFYSVTGSFTVPSPKPPSTSSSPGTWRGSAWVGIDSLPPTDVLVQAGIDWAVTKNSDGSVSTTYGAWYEWLPDPNYYFSNFALSAGDIITAHCQSSSPSNAECSLQNHNTGAVVSKTMTAPSGGDLDVGAHAAWVVEDFFGAGGQVPFADFGTIEFSNCQAVTQSLNGAAGVNTIYGLSNSEIYLMDTGTSVSISGQSMSVSYTGTRTTRTDTGTTRTTTGTTWHLRDNSLVALVMAFLLIITFST